MYQGIKVFVSARCLDISHAAAPINVAHYKCTDYYYYLFIYFLYPRYLGSRGILEKN